MCIIVLILLVCIVPGTSWWLWSREARYRYIRFISSRVSSAVCIVHYCSISGSSCAT